MVFDNINFTDEFGNEQKLEFNNFYCVDCMEVLKLMPDKSIDLCIVDPPYGVSIETSGTYFKQFKTKGWDNATPSTEYFKELFRVSQNQIIWGGNYFLEYLGNTKCFLIWDKMIGEGMSFADAELAWTSFKKPTRIKKLSSNNNGGKIHPTQKPVALYEWLLYNYAKQGDKILDTHVGSASSLIACHNLGFQYVGFEIDKEYYEKSLDRLETAKKQVSILDVIEKQENTQIGMEE